MNYPGNKADPDQVAKWMADIAVNEFGLPGILPVMASCAEITAAWTGPGDVTTIPGYSYSTDYDSLGYFQQRSSQGWGTPAQLVDADYALRAFCKEAVKYKGQFDANDPYSLGQWAQAVQRSAYPDRYTTKGYPLAKTLLESSGTVDYPLKQLKVNTDGWVYDPAASAWVKVEPNQDYKTDADGWLYRVTEPEQPDGWQWPVANDQPLGIGSYQDRHPTRYTWRADVEQWARYLVDNYNVWCNTYYDHPEGYWRTETSLDVWGPNGRNDPIDPAVGQQVFDLLFNDPGQPDIDWIIWQAWIWTRAGGWAQFGYDDFTWHYDHIHCTYV